MYDSYTVVNSGIEFICCYDVFWIMVFDLHQISDFTIGIHGKLNTYLDIDSFVLPVGNEVYFLGSVFPNIDFIPSSFEFQKNNVFKNAVKHESVIS